MKLTPIASATDEQIARAWLGIGNLHGFEDVGATQAGNQNAAHGQSSTTRRTATGRLALGGAKGCRVISTDSHEERASPAPSLSRYRSPQTAGPHRG